MKEQKQTNKQTSPNYCSSETKTTCSWEYGSYLACVLGNHCLSAQLAQSVKPFKTTVSSTTRGGKYCKICCSFWTLHWAVSPEQWLKLSQWWLWWNSGLEPRCSGSRQWRHSAGNHPDPPSPSGLWPVRKKRNKVAKRKNCQHLNEQDMQYWFILGQRSPGSPHEIPPVLIMME